MPLPTETYHLSSRQKWKLALSLIVIYYPILTYVNFPEWDRSWTGVQRGLPLFFIGSVVMVLFYFVWLSLVEWIQHRLFGWFGEDFLLELRLPAQLITLLTSTALAAAFLMAYGSVMYLLTRFLPHAEHRSPRIALSPEHISLFRRANEGFFLMLMLSAFYLIANSRALLRVRAFHRRTEQLENENLQAQFAALKNQVNPHFLFNSLSILSSLVYVDAELSEKFIDQLSRSYRYTLEQKDNDLVPLSTELDFIKSYTFLLKIRFEEKFDVVLDIPEADRQHYRVAPLTLQLLVENAVKHNQMSVENPLHVCIGLEEQELVVRNSLQRRPTVTASTGLGLQNILNRYRLLTPRPVRVEETDDTFVVRIPLLL
ncbi:sensor histidine kinase [Hymenobacter crusticola]|uniref:Signal transduction histidine kinase internal region domain-containing protein n=1 Tax=Hymenobacter crusticola TaxID=1770526 RepID=A0A243WEG0_9BACT|nr:histidine kinase [Hymenobacter crusticola]OUJ74093.1 hypothetical protein BXP70_10140 [Hymenobacter crusticola]